MKVNLRLPLLLITLQAPLCLSATELTVNFTATVKETTCAMGISALSGSAVSGDAASGNYYLDFPTMGVADITHKSALTEASFKVMPTNCNNDISSIKMTINGNRSGESNTLLINDNASSADASGIGVGFKRRGEDDNSRFTLDGSTYVDWTTDEIAQGMELTGIIRQLNAANDISPGAFQAKATFVFNYN